MRTALGSIVVGGLIGALLWTGLVGAQQPPGGLPACQASLRTCQTDLGKCNTALTVCEAEPDVVFPGDGESGPLLSYMNNGDDTFTDNNTLLIWEMKNNVGGIHWVHSVYTWSDAYDVFLHVLNTAPCFAGHCDWRLPTVKELQSIVDYSKYGFAFSFPGYVSTGINWSSTVTAGDPSFALGIIFSNGFVSATLKSNPQYVRAVRGGP